MLTLLPPEQVGVAALLFMRITGLVWVAPLFSARPVPVQMKVALTLLLTFMLLPAAAVGAGIASGAQGGVLADSPLLPGDAGAAAVFRAELARGFTGGLVNPASLVAELTVGIILGLGAGIFVAAAESAGDTVAVQMGLSGANVLNPVSATQLPILGQLLGLFVLGLILAVGGHILILQALARSLELAPTGAPMAAASGARAFVELGGELFVLGLRFAAPVVAAMMIGNAALGVMARTVPQLNVLTVAFPMQIAIGLFALAATLPLIAGYVADFQGHYTEVVGPLLRALTPLRGGV